MTSENEMLNLGMVIQDNELCELIVNILSDKYQLSVYNSLNDLFEQALTAGIRLILCEHDVLDGNEKQILKELKTLLPDSQTLVIGPKAAVDIQILMLRHGARGYFDQSLTSQKLAFALNSITHGEVWVERNVISGLIDNLTQGPKITDEQKALVNSLSPKETEVAQLVSHGATNKLIARQLDITERTVKAHLTTIFQKMGMTDRLSLAIFFRELR